MKIRIRRGIGSVGCSEGGIIRPKNYASGAFEVPDNVGRNLIARGLADLVDDQTAAIATPEQVKVEAVPTKKAAVKTAKGKPAPKKEQAKELDEMTLAELRAEAKARGIKVNARQSKAQLLAALRAPADSSEVEPTEDEPAPSFNPAASIA